MPLMVAGPGIPSSRFAVTSQWYRHGAGQPRCRRHKDSRPHGGINFLAKDYIERGFGVAALIGATTIERIRALVTPRFKYLRTI